MFHPKKIVTVLGVSALLLGSAAPLPFDLGSGPAFADNGKGGGNGGGGGGGNGGGGGGGNGGGAGGKGGEKSAGKSGGNGNGKSVERTVSREKPGSAKPKARQAAPAADDGEVVFAARDLGNMNGAMNANVNAVLAHIRNGNYSGPVGAVAALVAADAQAGDLVEGDVLVRAEAWETWRADAAAALGSDYELALDDYAADQMAFNDYQNALGTWTEANNAYQTALNDPNLTDEQKAALVDPGLPPAEVVFEPDPVLDALLAGQPQVEEPDPEDVERVTAVSDAEAAVLALWNKNPDRADGMSDEEEALLAELRARFSASELEAIALAAAP